MIKVKKLDRKSINVNNKTTYLYDEEWIPEVNDAVYRAKTWADGDDADVNKLGGTHSSMVAAGLAFAYAVAPEDTPVEEWATEHDLIVKGEKGEQGPKGEKGDMPDISNLATKSYVDGLVGDIETILHNINSGVVV